MVSKTKNKNRDAPQNIPNILAQRLLCKKYYTLQKAMDKSK